MSIFEVLFCTVNDERLVAQKTYLASTLEKALAKCIHGSVYTIDEKEISALASYCSDESKSGEIVLGPFSELARINWFEYIVIRKRCIDSEIVRDIWGMCFTTMDDAEDDSNEKIVSILKKMGIESRV